MVDNVNWANKPTIKDLKNDFTSCETFTSNHAKRVDTWLEVLDAKSPIPSSKEGEQGKPRSRVQPKLVRKNNEWRFSALSEALLSTPDFFRLFPVTWEDTDLAKQHEAVVNYQFRNQIGKTKLVDRAVRDFVNTGTVIFKPTWVQTKRKVKQTIPVFTYSPILDQAQIAQASELYQQMLQVKQVSPDSYEAMDETLRAGLEYSQENSATGYLYVAELVERREEEVEKIVVNKPHIEVCDYRDVFVDPTCKEDIRQAKFVVHRFEMSYSDIQNDPRYDVTLLEKEAKDNPSLLQGKSLDDERFSAEMENQAFKFKDKPREKFVIYEYWGYWDTNNDGQLNPIVCAWVNDVLVRMADNPYPDLDIPFCIGAYLPQKGTVYGEPDAELIADNQEIIGALTRGAIDLLARSANAQTGIPKDFLDQANRAKFMRGQDYEYNPNQHPSGAVFQHQYAVVSPSVSQIVQEQTYDAESLTGVKSFGNGGISGDSLGETAAGARIVNDATIQRTTSILRRLLDAFNDVAKKVIAMNAVYLTEVEVTRITNSPYLPPRDENETTSFDISVSIATAEADAQRANDLGFILQTATGNIDPALSQKILAEICRLKKMPDFAKEIENYQPQPDPLAQQERQAQIELTMAQAQLLKAQAQEALAKSQLNGAKIGETQAKTDHVNAQTNSKDINNMEVATGLNHQRQMELQKQKDDSKLIQQEQINQSKADIENNKLAVNLATQGMNNNANNA